jgi:L-alanine-DL-glutamate epimerase-like enolase superfamily enzyme
MRVTSITATPVSVPYRHPEVSTQIKRDGVSDVVVRIETSTGLVGWGESFGGSSVGAVRDAVEAMAPFVVGRSPWEADAIRAELYWQGLWQFRPALGNAAWAGIDTALWDLCGESCQEPLYHLLGGLRRDEATYFYYLTRAEPEAMALECRSAIAAGFETFYLKVGLDLERDLEMVAAVRDAIGSLRLRLDANGVWTLDDARRNIGRFAEYDIDFFEQPVRWFPLDAMTALRRDGVVRIAVNEGLWSEQEAYERIRAGVADVVCFSPQWVGSLGAFRRLAYVADLEGMRVCKHSHGELGIAAAACHHAVLTLPNAVEGHQQTATMIEYDIVRERLPLCDGPRWGVPQGAGLGVEVDEDALEDAAERYRIEGQFLPYDRGATGRTLEPSGVSPAGGRPRVAGTSAAKMRPKQ